MHLTASTPHSSGPALGRHGHRRIRNATKQFAEGRFGILSTCQFLHLSFCWRTSMRPYQPSLIRRCATWTCILTCILTLISQQPFSVGDPPSGGGFTPPSEVEAVMHAKCVTMLNPKRCSSLGNSMCQAAGTPCFSSCNFCSSSVAIPGQGCIYQYHHQCFRYTSAADCGSTSDWMEGTCDTGECFCDAVRTGDCGNRVRVAQCSIEGGIYGP